MHAGCSDRRILQASKANRFCQLKKRISAACISAARQETLEVKALLRVLGECVVLAHISSFERQQHEEI